MLRWISCALTKLDIFGALDVGTITHIFSNINRTVRTFQCRHNLRSNWRCILCTRMCTSVCHPADSICGLLVGLIQLGGQKMDGDVIDYSIMSSLSLSPRLLGVNTRRRPPRKHGLKQQDAVCLSSLLREYTSSFPPLPPTDAWTTNTCEYVSLTVRNIHRNYFWCSCFKWSKYLRKTTIIEQVIKFLSARVKFMLCE